MIPIPEIIRLKLIELDKQLQMLGRQLYGKKLVGEYLDNGRFQNFSLELHLNGSFTLHFQKRILGSIEQKTFEVADAAPSSALSEIDLLLAMVGNQLQRVGGLEQV